ncbi:MAG TPA: diacylglycerol kinase family lipid kinase [Anaerolinea thermolimosa]|uniref:Diacylglycerol kinase family lipid kinase n=1 Tax=Anaerolinea thermolimosa TaxID=229919 RepID=A0A3D1JJB2_9CHLR|nr:diacylglycerol kinase family protein [Anaerolinea thermolimosa]GAP05325.1 lipid kinase, YegS/Rv2252/BmrU family [Anaerolinea thermolimosa]HCE18315.1 diacylglycerol kinase family lipid kinase [Anaerolinea thermolimosa]
MLRKKVKLIFNPIANLGRSWPIASSLRPLLTELGGADWTGTVYPTHAAELARQAGEEGYEKVIAMGGDGTVHEVVNGLMQLPPEKRPILGIVPVGTGNDFAYSLGISSIPEEALRQAFQGPVHEIDVAHVEDNRGHSEYWTNTLGIGFDALINIRSRRVALFQGFAVYFLAMMQALILDYTPYKAHLRTDHQEWDESLLMMVICNGKREGGGFHIAPQASQQDGLLNSVRVPVIRRRRMLLTVPYFMNGTHEKLSYVHSLSFRTLEINSDRPLYIHSDGEIYAGMHSTVNHLKIECLPSAIRAVAPGFKS